MPDASTASLTSSGAMKSTVNVLAAIAPCIGALFLALQRRSRHIDHMSETTCIAALESRGLIAVSGEDWRSFLQGLLTQDVETLRAREARFGALLTPQGRLLYDLFVVGREGGCWLDCQAERRAALLQRLAIY